MTEPERVTPPPTDPTRDAIEAAALAQQFHEAADDDPEAVHGWFELTYANYLVLPRTLMQSMPAKWQTGVVKLLREIRAAYPHLPQAEAYHVQAGRWAYPSDLSTGELEALGFKQGGVDDEDGEDAGELNEVWYGPDGEEHDGHTASIFVPCEDPIPHYNRGRTRVEPRSIA